MIRTYYKDSKLILKSRIEQKYLNTLNIPTLNILGYKSNNTNNSLLFNILPILFSIISSANFLFTGNWLQ